jgi:hypothetical protein
LPVFRLTSFSTFAKMAVKVLFRPFSARGIIDNNWRFRNRFMLLRPRITRRKFTMRNLILITSLVVLTFCLSHTALAQNFAMEFFADPGDSAQAPDSDSLDVTGKAFTMEVWGFATGPQKGDGIFINKEDSYEMALRNGDLFMFAIQAGAWDWFGGGKPSMKEWHHFAVTYDGKVTQGWIDGKAAPAPTKANNIDLVKQDGGEAPFRLDGASAVGVRRFWG